jgi:hypothetical protein
VLAVGHNDVSSTAVRAPSDIRLSPTARITAVGHKVISDGQLSEIKRFNRASREHRFIFHLHRARHRRPRAARRHAPAGHRAARRRAARSRHARRHARRHAARRCAATPPPPPSCCHTRAGRPHSRPRHRRAAPSPLAAAPPRAGAPAAPSHTLK